MFIFKQKQNKQEKRLFILLIITGIVILTFIFLYTGGLQPFFLALSPHPAPIKSNTRDAVSGEKTQTPSPRKTRTPEEWVKEKVAWEKLKQLEKQPIRMQAGFQNSGWLLLTDEQRHRQGTTDGKEYFDEIPIAYHTPEMAAQTYRVTDTVSLTATVTGKENGTYLQRQSGDRHKIIVTVHQGNFT